MTTMDSDLRDELLRFAQRVLVDVPEEAHPSVQWHQVHEDLGSLIVEARRGRPRPELLRMLMRRVTEELAAGGVAPATVRALRESSLPLG